MALYNDDIIQTAIYLNIPLQTGILFQSRELVAAFAGHGLGLCEHPEDRDGCYDELQRLPVKQVFHVEYTAKAMLFHTAPLRGAIDLADSDIRAVALWDMGGEARGEKDYVEKLRDYVLKFVKEGRFSEEWETVVVMTGDEECVGDEEVKDVIRDGLKMAGITAVRILDARPEFVAARGAAELCFRGRKQFKI
ncbi:hypothetical protein M7I_3925 [Glarea lozoyensis 74030]|uniref:Uncharacterized protein n=1 Tax=Glarea lozoyensis (strain ATCC 74030 / MF5533) TaxID=1104152 RepID=H0EMS8_GLAL7|nr:hypothetical protein M7I_3925 [Glarea lozoyensis 74030]